MTTPDDTIRLDPKDRLSRALGAAFLGHQVSQLENRIGGLNVSSRGGYRGRGGRGGARGSPPKHANADRFRGTNSPRGSRGAASIPYSPSRAHSSVESHADHAPLSKDRERPPMAQVIVLDASVLVHALGQVKRWCRDDRKELLIVPLEALNTLDLLKKGTSNLAVSARAASRFLEAQVGANSRVQVQRDEDFVPWNELYKRALQPIQKPSNDGQPTITNSPTSAIIPSDDHAPEWMRQMICCTAYEVKHSPSDSPYHVALAVIKPFADASVVPADVHDTSVIRYVQRAAGDLLRIWAPFFDIKLLNIDDGTSDRAEHYHRSDGFHHKSRGAHHADGPSPRKNSRGTDYSYSRQPIVEKVHNGVTAATTVTVTPGVGKVRLLTRGEKLDP